MSDAPSLIENIVVHALAAEYVRVREKVRGANQRLTYAYSQVESEGKLLQVLDLDLALLADAITRNGGAIPPEENVQ